MKMVPVVSAIMVMLLVALATCSLDPSVSALDNMTIAELDLDLLDLNLAARHIEEMGVGSPCASSEGAWFCMSSSFQRYASGQWSAALACAPGTVCQPEGLTYDLQSAFGIDPAAPATTTTVASSTCSAGRGTSESSSSKKTMTTTTDNADTATVTAATITTTAAETEACSGAEPTTCTTDSAEATGTASTGVPKKDSSAALRGGFGFFSWSLMCVGGLFLAAVMI